MANNNGSKILLFLINPFLSAINSLINIRDKQSQKLLYLWFLVFGAAFCAVDKTADSFRWVEIFNVESRYSFQQYLSDISEYFSFDSDIKDIYGLSVNFLVGRFTDNYHWTYFIYAAVFGFFYIKTLDLLLRYNVENKWAFYAFLFMFCFSNPIFNINGMRMWTAAWIGVYSVLKIILDNKKRYLLLLLLTPLIHDSFFIWIAFFLFAYLTWRAKDLWVGLFVLSSVVSAISYLDLLQEFSYLFPQFIQNQIWSYTQSIDALEIMSGSIQASMPLYARVFNALPGYFTLLLSYLLIFNRKIINESHCRTKFFYIYLAIASLANFVSGIPSMGRFKALCVPLLMINWAMNPEIIKKYSRWLLLTPVVYCYKILYWVRSMIAVTEIWLYILPAPITLIKYLFIS